MIRPAEVSDIDAVCAISEAQPRSAGWAPRQYADELGNPRTYFAVLDEDGVAAYALFKVLEPEAELVDVAVAPDRARRGLGRRLLESAFPALKARGVLKIGLEVSEGNVPARGLYERLGFRVVGRRAKFYNDGSDAVLMDLELP